MKIRYVTCLIIIALTGSMATAMAETRWDVDPAQLPPGLTKEKAVAMLEEIEHKTARERADEEAAQQRKAERVRRAAQKYEERLARAVDKDPELRVLRDKIEAGAKALENPELSEAERTERLKRMAPDLNTLRSKGLAKAGIDERAMNEEIRGALSDGVKPRGDTGDEAETLKEEGGAFYFVSPDDAPPPASEVTTRGTTTKILKEPWPYAEEETNIGNYGGKVDTAAGKYTAYAHVQWAGAGTNRRGLAHFLTVPAGTSTIRVTAQLPETVYYDSAGVILFGGAQSKSYSKIEVWDDSSRLLCRRSKVHADVWALVMAFFTQEGKHNIPLACEFDAPAAGHELVILHVSDAFAQAWGNGYAQTKVEAEPADVRIELISPTTTIKKLYYR